MDAIIMLWLNKQSAERHLLLRKHIEHNLSTSYQSFRYNHKHIRDAIIFVSADSTLDVTVSLSLSLSLCLIIVPNVICSRGIYAKWLRFSHTPKILLPRLFGRATFLILSSNLHTHSSSVSLWVGFSENAFVGWNVLRWFDGSASFIGASFSKA